MSLFDGFDGLLGRPSHAQTIDELAQQRVDIVTAGIRQQQEAAQQLRQAIAAQEACTLENAKPKDYIDGECEVVEEQLKKMRGE